MIHAHAYEGDMSVLGIQCTDTINRSSFQSCEGRSRGRWEARGRTKDSDENVTDYIVGRRTQAKNDECDERQSNGHIQNANWTQFKCMNTKELCMCSSSSSSLPLLLLCYINIMLLPIKPQEWAQRRVISREVIVHKLMNRKRTKTTNANQWTEMAMHCKWNGVEKLWW